MCSVIVLNHHVKDIPLIIAANRDELETRKSKPVQILSKEPLIIGGQDQVFGGSWLAANEHGLFATVTNQGVRSEKEKRSRGLLILDALKCKSIEEMVSFVEAIDVAKYNAFNLVFGNNKSVYVAHSYILHSVAIREIPIGVSLITSDFTYGKCDKKHYVHKKLDTIQSLSWLETYKKLKVMLSSSENGMKIPQKKDGRLCTRSSSILAFDDKGLSRFKFFDRTKVRAKRKEGDPFVPRYHDYIELMREKIESEDQDDTDDIDDIADSSMFAEDAFKRGWVSYGSYSDRKWKA